MRSRSYLLSAGAALAFALLACQGEEGDSESSADNGGGVGVSVGSGGRSGDGDGGVIGAGGSVTGDGDLGAATCDILTLLSDKCGTCHGVDATFGALDLVAPDLEIRLVDVPSVSCPDWNLVVPGSPERSNLYQKVASDTPPCGDRMPLKEVLTGNEISCIANYIRSLSGTEPVEPCETCGGTTCVDLEVDIAHCGACGDACSPGQQCVGGVCEGCPLGTEACGGQCVDVLSDLENCGACGVVCGGGQSCVDGACTCSTGPLSVSFAADIQPILTDACATNGCHAQTGGMAPGGRPTGAGPGDVNSDLVLDAAVAYEMLVGSPSGCNGMDFVEPGDVSSSYLMNKLTGSAMCGGTKMPKGGAPLTQAELDLIGNWICAGAGNN